MRLLQTDWREGVARLAARWFRFEAIVVSTTSTVVELFAVAVRSIKVPSLVMREASP